MGLSIRTRITIAAILLLAIQSVSTDGHAQEEEIAIDNPTAYARNQRTGVMFSHALHMELYDCLDCHHDYADGENVLDESALWEGNPDIRCETCHELQSALDLRHAYHRQCIGCHRRMRIDGSAVGPELCGECHIR